MLGRMQTSAGRDAPKDHFDGFSLRRARDASIRRGASSSEIAPRGPPSAKIRHSADEAE